MSDLSVDSLNIDVVTSTDHAKKGIDSLIDTLEQLKNVSSRFKGGSLAKRLNQIESALNGINGETSGKLAALSNSIEKLSNARISSTIPKCLTQIGDALRSIDGVDKLDSIANATQRIGEASSRNSEAASNKAGWNQPKGIHPVNETRDYVNDTKSATRAQEGMNRTISRTPKLFRAMQSALGTTAKLLTTIASRTAGATAKLPLSFFQSVAGGFKKLGSSVTGFARRIGRVSMYRIIRGLIATITSGLDEGIKNLYQYSIKSGDQFKGSMDKLATAALYVKNSFAAMAAPLINAVAPAIDAIADKVVSLVNQVNKVFASLTGNSSTLVARKIKTDFADAADSTKSKTKKTADEIKKTIMGFDELNVLNKNSSKDSSNSNSNEKKIPDYGNMFERIPIESNISNFTKRLKDSILSGDWKGAGSLLGDKVNSVVNSVDWHNLGGKLGFGFNGAIQTLYHFLDTVDFTNIGQKVAELFNGTGESVDWEYIGRLWTKRLTMALDFVIGFCSEYDWGGMASGLSDIIIGIFDEATEWIQKYDWSKVGSGIYNGLKDVITNIKWSEITESIAKFLGSAIGAVGSLLVGFFQELGKDIEKHFKKYVTNEDGTRKTGIDIVKGVLKGIVDGLANIGQWLYDHFCLPFIKAFKKTFKINSPSKLMAEMGVFLIEGLKNGITSGIQKVIDTVLGISTKITTGLKNAWASISTNTKSAWTNIGNALANGLSNGANGISKVMNNISSILSKSVGNFASSMFKWGSEMMQHLVDGIAGGLESLKSKVETAAGTIRSFLHFSKPDVGPLTDIDTWMPDMMSQLASGIDQNRYRVTNEMEKVANDMNISSIITAKTDSNYKTGNSENLYDILLSAIIDAIRQMKDQNNDDNDTQITINIGNEELGRYLTKQNRRTALITGGT